MKNNFDQFVEQKYPPAGVFLGYFFIGLSVLLFSTQYLFSGATLLIIGVYLAFSIIGIQVEKSKNRFKYYNRHFWVKQGEWKSFKDFPDVCVLLTNLKGTSYYGAGIPITTKNRLFVVFLLNETHREKLLIKEFKTEEKAILYAKDFAERSGTNFTVFSPYISEATLSRRR